jgi:acetyltransferase-like isoleucine patch superfamily enzyme
MTQNSKLVIYNWLTKVFPSVSVCRRVRIACLKWAGINLGRCVEIGDGVVVRGDGEICIGDNVRIYDDVYILCKKNGKVSLDNNVCLATRVYIESGGNIEVGEGTFVMQESLLTANCGSTLKIGKDCQIAHMVSLKTSTHDIDVLGKCVAGSERFDDIEIGNGVWLCAGAIVIPGVKIGDRVVVAAGAVVTKCIEARRMVAGVPAVEKKRF